MPATETTPTPTTSRTPSSAPLPAPTQSAGRRKPYAVIRVEFYDDGQHEVNLVGQGERIRNAEFQRRIPAIFRAIGRSKQYARLHTTTKEE